MIKLSEIITPDTWLASDHHFGHARLALFEPMREQFRRDNNYTSLEEMLIQRHNNIVKPGDNVLFLGDVAWKGLDTYIKKLNGKKYLILGNHDTRGDNAYKHFEHVFRGIYLDIEGYTLHHPHRDPLMSMCISNNFVFCHYALFHRDEYDFQRGSYIEPRMDYCEAFIKDLKLPIKKVIHGHLHSKITGKPLHINVCLEHTNLSPVQLKSII